ncbi:hypothetical protein D9M71_548150 [compost metagenome]
MLNELGAEILIKLRAQLLYERVLVLYGLIGAFGEFGKFGPELTSGKFDFTVLGRELLNGAVQVAGGYFGTLVILIGQSVKSEPACLLKRSAG